MRTARGEARRGPDRNLLIDLHITGSPEKLYAQERTWDIMVVLELIIDFRACERDLQSGSSHQIRQIYGDKQDSEIVEHDG